MVKKNIFAVCDTDFSYAYNFIEFINKKRTFPLDAHAFTDIEQLLEFTKENTIEILLISEKIFQKEAERIEAGHICLLYENAANSDNKNYKSIYKYQSCDRVISEIMLSCADDPCKDLEISRKRTTILGVYSPSGHPHKNAFALALGILLAEGRNVLYLSLEAYAGFEEIFDISYEQTLSDLLYSIRQGHENINMHMRSMIKKFYNLDYIPPVSSPPDISLAKYKDWMRIKGEIEENSAYEYLIMDFGVLPDEFLRQLSQCDVIFALSASDLVSRAKLQQFERLLERLDYPDIAYKLRRICLPAALGGGLIPEELKEYVRDMLQKGY